MGAKRLRPFDAPMCLDWAGVATAIVEYRRAEVIFSQGDAGKSVMYVQKGGVKLSVRSQTGREAVVAMLGPGEFFGEGCLAGQQLRVGNATAITSSTIFVVAKAKMARLLHKQHTLSDRFIAGMLARNIRIEEDLVDQLFDSIEKRLARTLLRLARYGEQRRLRRVLSNISLDSLADMVGTTGSRVNVLMNKFKKLGFIEDHGRLRVNSSLLSVVLHD